MYELELQYVTYYVNVSYNVLEKADEQNSQIVPFHGLREDRELRIVLLGKTGSGKSATGNTILKSRCFESRKSPRTVTLRCSAGYTQRFGRTIQVVDTPGTLGTNLTEDALKLELARCIGLSSPGPHCFLLVLDSTRFTEVEKKCIEYFADNYGNNFYHYLVVVFTRKDDLDRENTTIEEYLDEAEDSLKEILQECNNRYIAFNNMDNSPIGERQVEDLLQIIDGIIRQNNGHFYTNEMYAAAEERIRRREREILMMQRRQNRIDNPRRQVRKEIEGGNAILSFLAGALSSIAFFGMLAFRLLRLR